MRALSLRLSDELLNAVRAKSKQDVEGVEEFRSLSVIVRLREAADDQLGELVPVFRPGRGDVCEIRRTIFYESAHS